MPIPLPRLTTFTLGRPDAEWSGSLPHITAFAQDDAEPVDPRLFSGDLRLAWTEEGLVVLVSMRSSLPWSEAPEVKTAYQADSIELFLRQGSRWANMLQSIIAPGLDANHREARTHVWDYRGDPKDWADLPASVSLARHLIDGGCRIKALIPWAQLRLTAAPGLEVEFRINLNKVIPGIGRRQLVWRRPDGNDFQQLVLADGAVPTTRVDRVAWSAVRSSDLVGFSAIIPGGEPETAFSLRQGAMVLASTRMTPQADRSTGTLWIAPTSLSGFDRPFELYVGDHCLAVAKVEDPAPVLQRDLETAFLRNRGNSDGDGPADRLTPRLPAFLTTGTLPEATIPDATLAARAGVTGLKTRWFNATGAPTTKATALGRYGAEITATLADGSVLRCFRTAVLAAENWRSAGGRSLLTAAFQATGDQPADDRVLASAARRVSGMLDNDGDLARLAAAASEREQDGGLLLPDRRDAAWWHHVRTSQGTETVYPYAKRLPTGYDAEPGKRWPAIIYLHGSGGRLPRDTGDLTQRLATAGDRDLLGWSKGRNLPFALYALHSSGGWEPPAVLAAVERILAEDRIDPDRLILMGFSMGGMGTWSCAVDYPERWAAAVPIGGRGAYAAEADRLGKLPVWVFNGDIDATTTLADAQKIVRALEKIGGDVRLTILPGIGHGGSQNGTFDTPGLWEWLGERTRTR